MKLSVVLATFNEENNIVECLQSVKEIADETVVVDGSSQDRTREIAESLGARIIKTQNRKMFHTNKQMAIDAARGEWILQLDADERVDSKLRHEIKTILRQGSDHAAYAIPRKNIFLGRWLRKGGQYPDYCIRLFKRGMARFPQKSVHEQMDVRGTIGSLNGHLVHHTAPTLERYMRNANRYTTLTAEGFLNKGMRIDMGTAIRYLVLKPALTFTTLFIRHKGLIDGFPGFVFALFSGLHWPISYLKLWELKRKKKEVKGCE